MHTITLVVIGFCLAWNALKIRRLHKLNLLKEKIWETDYEITGLKDRIKILERRIDFPLDDRPESETETINWKSPDEPPEHSGPVFLSVLHQTAGVKTVREGFYTKAGGFCFTSSHYYINGERFYDDFSVNGDIGATLFSVLAWAEWPEPATERVAKRGSAPYCHACGGVIENCSSPDKKGTLKCYLADVARYEDRTQSAEAICDGTDFYEVDEDEKECPKCGKIPAHCLCVEKREGAAS